MKVGGVQRSLGEDCGGQVLTIIHLVPSCAAKARAFSTSIN